MGRRRIINHRPIIKTIIALLLALSVSGCSSSMQSIIDSGAEKYAQGKETESYSIVTIGDLLDELLDKYTGGLTQPEKGSGAEYDQWIENRKEEIEVVEVPDEVTNREDLFNVVYSALRNTQESVSFRYSASFDTANFDDLLDVLMDVLRISPMDVVPIDEYWCTYRSGDCTIYFQYKFSIDETLRMKKAVDDAVNTIVQQLDVAGKSDYEIVVAVDQYLCDHVYYPQQKPYKDVEYTVYGALINGCAVCEGYAGAVQMLLTACGVEVDIEVGVCTNGENHAWNLVKVDGIWYQLDTCWNDGGSTNMYFLVSDEFMKESRIWDENRYPVCLDSYSMQQAA